jgi:DNA-binding beta-propeller fold protein YncE
MNRRCVLKLLVPLGVLAFVASLRAGDVPLTDGQNAEDVVGQFDGGGNPVFTQGSPYNSQPLNGLNLPYDVAIDTAGHRLFVSDSYSNRVLVYDLNSSNDLVDRAADHVLGQTNFYNNSSGLSQNRMYSLIGLHFDAGSNRLFVADNGNSRVLVFDLTTITDGENAINVLGQANFNSATGSTSQGGMRNPQGVFYDPGTSRLFVGDTYNHRVLIFDLTVVTDGENAVNVLGQPDFTSGNYSTTQSGLYYPRMSAYDSSTSRLFVADYSNSRVMVFDVAAITDGENAINVLGQTTFTTRTAATTQNGLYSLFGLTFDGKTQRLFVSDSGNSRVVVFDMASITNGENAVNVLGQSTYNAGSGATAINRMYYPRGIAYDSGGDRLWVSENTNYRVTAFDGSTTSITNGANAINVVGQTDGAGGAVYTTGYNYDGIADKGMNLPFAVLVDTVSHRLFVGDYLGNRILVYDLDQSNTLVDRTVDHLLGQQNYRLTTLMTNQYSIYGPRGLAMDYATNRLFVSNYNSHRVVVFDVASITDGENAINVLGQSTFSGSGAATTQSGLYYPTGLAFEPETNRLYVAEVSNNRITVFDVASITDGENAINVLGQPDFTTSAYATTQSGLYNPQHITIDGAHRLFVADYTNHRILVFDTTVITDGENAISVIGQTDFTTRTSGRTQSKMVYPMGVSIDPLTNRLFVADSSNFRVTVFDVAAITDGENAVNVLGQVNFTAGAVATTASGMANVRGVSYEAGMNRLYIADTYNNRVIVQSVGPVPPSTSTLTAVAGGQAGAINLSWPSAGDDGSFGALTGYYRIQYATYTATWSTSTTPTNAYTSTITATGVTPGVVQSTTVYVSPTVQPWYFVIWTQDDASNWSAISSTVSASPPTVIPNYGVGPFEVASVGGGLSQGGTAWGDFDNDGDLDVVVSGTDGTNNQIRVYESYGNGSFNSTAVNVAAANSGLKDGDVAFGDYDNDGDLDVLVNGTDGTNNQLRVYKNNGNGTFNTTAVEVAGTNSGLKQGGVAWGDYDNDGDLDVLVSGTDGTNNQLRVYKNKGDGTFDSTAVNVAGVNSGLKQGGVAWGDFDQDGDVDVLVNGTDGTNRQLRVYKNNGDGTFNSTAVEVAGANSGLADGRVVWSDFNKDGYLDVLVSGTDGTNGQLRVYMNNGNGTFNSTPVNVAGANTGSRIPRWRWAITTWTGTKTF